MCNANDHSQTGANLNARKIEHPNQNALKTDQQFNNDGKIRDMFENHSRKMFQAKEHLFLVGQKYSHIPVEIILQHKPKLLDLSQNYIGDWPGQNDLQKNRELETLILVKNQITRLPLYVMGAFPNLKKLDLRDNQIVAMPAFHRKTSVLRQLEYLDLGKNRLQLFPLSFVLSISRGSGLLNHSQSFPTDSKQKSPDQSVESGVQSINCLQTLLLDMNQLESIPAEIAELESLQTLHL